MSVSLSEPLALHPDGMGQVDDGIHRGTLVLHKVTSFKGRRIILAHVAQGQ